MSDSTKSENSGVSRDENSIIPFLKQQIINILYCSETQSQYIPFDECLQCQPRQHIVNVIKLDVLRICIPDNQIGQSLYILLLPRHSVDHRFPKDDEQKQQDPRHQIGQNTKCQSKGKVFRGPFTDIKWFVISFQIFQILSAKINANRQNVGGPHSNPFLGALVLAREVSHRQQLMRWSPNFMNKS